MFVVRDNNDWRNIQPRQLKSQTWNGAALTDSMLFENVLPSCSELSAFVTDNE